MWYRSPTPPPRPQGSPGPISTAQVTLATLQSKKWDIHMDADSNFRISELMNLPTEAPLRSELKK